MGASPPWLLLIHQVAPKPDYLRVKVRRRLHQIGAVAVKSTVYALPRSEQAIEDFEWVLREIVEAGGQGAICEAGFLAGMTDGELEALFRAERASDYAEIDTEVRAMLKAAPTNDRRAELESALLRLRKRHAQVQAIDFLGAPEASATESNLRALEARIVSEPTAEAAEQEISVHEKPRGKTWVTRKGVYVDRIASAWLVQRFIDPKAKFKFVPGRGYKPSKGELRFDMFEGEYTHEGTRCTFEVLLDRFALRAEALAAIGEVVHDLDFKDEKYGRPETAGIEQIIAGIAMANRDDSARIERGSAVFDDLHAYLSKKGSKPRTALGQR